MNMLKSHDHTMLSEEKNSILVKMTFFTPVTATWPLIPNWSSQKCAFADLLLWPSLSIIGPRVSHVDRLKEKKKKKEETLAK